MLNLFMRRILQISHGALLGLCFVLGFEAYAQTSTAAYGLYGLYPQGSTRVLAMGGASAGHINDASATFFNPAGLATSKWRVDVNSGENRIVDKEVDLGGGKVGLPYTFTFTNGAIRIGDFALGAGVSTPYEAILDLADLGLETETISVNSVDVALAYKFSKSFSIGVAGHQETTQLTHVTSSSGVELVDEQQQTYPSVGLMLKPKRGFGFGLTYSPERRYDVDETLNDSITTGFTNWFRDIVIPAKATLGLSYKMSGRLLWVFDYDYFFPVKNAISVFGGLVNDSNALIQEKAQTVLHGGYEYEIIDSKDLAFIWRGGGYMEPARLEGSDPRTHFTMGIQFRVGIVSMSAAYDQAEGFSNTASSISLNFGAL